MATRSPWSRDLFDMHIFSVGGRTPDLANWYWWLYVSLLSPTSRGQIRPVRKDGGLDERDFAGEQAESDFYNNKALNAAAQTLQPGSFAGPFEVGSDTEWLYLDRIERRSITWYDAQVEIENEIRGRRLTEGRNKYIDRLIARGSDPRRLDTAFEVLRKSRPTAVNLFWALARMRRAVDAGADAAALEREAIAIEREDLEANRHMGQLGAALIAPGSGVLTHCNTGSLATAGFGTALGVIRAGYSGGRIARVFADETRPWLQGSRLTVWELLRDRIPAKLIADAADAHLMSTGAVQWAIVGADRITANGDVANKIGTLQIAIAAKHFGVKFMVVAPSTTVDMGTATGTEIEIELRDPKELLEYAGVRAVAQGVDAWNPVFDVTPAALIDAIVTEKGVVERPDPARMKALFG